MLLSLMNSVGTTHIVLYKLIYHYEISYCIKRRHIFLGTYSIVLIRPCLKLLLKTKKIR